ncbi:bZIP transcription factor 11-like [Prosopis cineraria]|uniref:bZIP transcription factor 11-like n=1 Tax=Prosopis cineraria TaxID=364024 RepID=UPI00240F59C7|nr:bZIP transcription factor 11-like [Prosopis cineraria]
MASPGGSGGGSASDSPNIIDQKKRKRMLSNRESARRSRMKKQQHQDDLVKQVGELKKENHEIIRNLSITNQLYVNMEAENAILRTQMAELTNRLESLNEIISYINNNSSNNYLFDDGITNDAAMINDCGFFNPNWINQPAIVASGNYMMY